MAEKKPSKWKIFDKLKTSFDKLKTSNTFSNKGKFKDTLNAQYADSNIGKVADKTKPMIILIGIILLLLFFVVPFIIAVFAEVNLAEDPVVTFVGLVFAGIILFFGGFK